MTHRRIQQTLTLTIALVTAAGCDKMPVGKLPEQASKPVVDPLTEEHKRILLDGLGDPSLSIWSPVTHHFAESFTCGSVSTTNDGIRQFIVRGDSAFAAKTEHGDKYVEACCHGLTEAYSSPSAQEDLLQRANASCAVIAKASTDSCHGEWAEYKVIGTFLDAYDSPTWLDTEFKIAMHSPRNHECEYKLYKEMGDGHKEEWPLRRDGKLFIRGASRSQDALGPHYIISADGLEIRDSGGLISIAKPVAEAQ